METRAEVLPESETDRLLEDDIERSEQKEHLYLDVLYAIANTVGAPAPGGQVTSSGALFLSVHFPSTRGLNRNVHFGTREDTTVVNLSTTLCTL